MANQESITRAATQGVVRARRPSRVAASLTRSASIADLRTLAKRRLPKPLFDFIDGGAGDERTLRANERAFGEWYLLPRYGVDVSSRSLVWNILGSQASLPLVLAPVGFAGLFFPDGECAAARAAAAAGIPFCLSTNSVASLEDIAAAAPSGDRWFQLYFLKDREWLRQLVRRAADARYRVLCVTIDLPVAGRRERDIRNGFTIPLHPLDVLAEIVAAIDGRVPVILDGGVRRGSDIIKAIALGASACMVGRAFAWGLAAAGGPGVSQTIEILRAELDNGLALLGVPSIGDLGRHCLRQAPALPFGTRSGEGERR